MGYFCKPRRWRAAAAVVGILLAAGCAGSGDDGGDATPGPKRPVLIAWSALYPERVPSYGCDDLRMLRNFFQTLGQKQTGLRILWATEGFCDPRTDPKHCGYTNWAAWQAESAPFFKMIDEIGTLDYGSPTVLDPFGYDVVIYPACLSKLATIKTTLDRFIATATHGGILVVGSNSCSNYGTTGSDAANALVSRYGIRYDTIATYHGKVCTSIPATARTGLLMDVASASVRDAVPLEVSAPAQTLYVAVDGRPVAAVYERANP